ncbi:MAG: Rpn family recombination-promoting nuclease/putative transposase [Erysipelotrichaceae bacterium]|nr:Rpn family recombination-promoting nuclease/putative transposase [Erysipelotrichaceae bacterium]
MKETKFYKDYMNNVYPSLKVHFDKHGTDAKYRSDLFLKYALSKNPEILIRLCEDLLHDKINGITILHSHLAVSSRTNKKLGLDFYVEDDNHRCYNLEFRNYYLTLNERRRINYYGTRMMNDRNHRGQSYSDVPDCYQAVYYLDYPLSMFHGFEDDYLKCIRSSSLPYDGENLISKIFTIKRIDKHLKGKTNLTFTEQLCYLLLHDVPYPYEEADELIKDDHNVKSIQ